jgi:uncharacterized protein
MTQSCIHTSVPELMMKHEPVLARDVAGGQPTIANTGMKGVGGYKVGIWEMTPGSVNYIEEDELIVVLSGLGELVVHDEKQTIPIGPGSLLHMRKGQRTTWRIIETLRKVYITA